MSSPITLSGFNNIDFSQVLDRPDGPGADSGHPARDPAEGAHQPEDVLHAVRLEAGEPGERRRRTVRAQRLRRAQRDGVRSHRRHRAGRGHDTQGQLRRDRDQPGQGPGERLVEHPHGPRFHHRRQRRHPDHRRRRRHPDRRRHPRRPGRRDQQHAQHRRQRLGRPERQQLPAGRDRPGDRCGQRLRHCQRPVRRRRRRLRRGQRPGRVRRRRHGQRHRLLDADEHRRRRRAAELASAGQDCAADQSRS